MAGGGRKLVLEARTSVDDGAGGVVEAWAPVATHWAALRPRSGRERFSAGRQFAVVSHVARIRHVEIGDMRRPAPDQRFREGERIFEIRGVTEADDLRRELICWLDEGASS